MNAASLKGVWTDVGIANEVRFEESDKAKNEHIKAMSQASQFYSKLMNCEAKHGQLFNMTVVKINEVRAYIMITGRFMLIAMFNMPGPMSILGGPELTPEKGIATVALADEDWDIAEIAARLTLSI